MRWEKEGRGEQSKGVGEEQREEIGQKMGGGEERRRMWEEEMRREERKGKEIQINVTQIIVNTFLTFFCSISLPFQYNNI